MTFERLDPLAFAVAGVSRVRLHNEGQTGRNMSIRGPRCPKCNSQDMTRSSLTLGELGSNSYDCHSCNRRVDVKTMAGILGDQVKRDLYKQSWRWPKYLLRNPDLLITLLACVFSLAIWTEVGPLSAGTIDRNFIRTMNPFSITLTWLATTAITCVGPVLAVLYIRRRRTKLHWADAWRATLTGSWVQPLYAIAACALLVVVLLILRIQSDYSMQIGR